MATNPIICARGHYADGREAILVATPYHPDFAPAAKGLHGSFNATSKRWSFDARDTAAVQAICRQLFGYDWTGLTPTVTVHLTLQNPNPPYSRLNQDAVTALGGVLIERRGRDVAVELARGAYLRAGAFTPTGGSARYPEIGEVAGIELEVRDVPVALAESFLGALPAWVESAWIEEPALPVAAAGGLAPGGDPAVLSALAAFEALSATQQATFLAQVGRLLPTH